MKTVQKLWSWLAAAAVLLALAVTISFWAFAQIEASAEARRSCFLELKSANELMSRLKDAETTQRGYVLTGDEKLLATYATLASGFNRQLKELHALALSPESDRQIDAMEPLMRNCAPTVASKTTAAVGYAVNAASSGLRAVLPQWIAWACKYATPEGKVVGEGVAGYSLCGWSCPRLPVSL